MKQTYILTACLIGLLASCTSKTKVDLLVHNAQVYTVDSTFSKASAFAVKDGKFVEVGDSKALLSKYEAKKEVDAQNQPVYPGFFDAHCHFYGYGTNQRIADLTATKSWPEVIAKVMAHRKANPQQAWLQGRGWDQNDWSIQEYPTNDTLNQLFPDIPVILRRVDGHAAFVNQKALELAGIQPGQRVSGGLVEMHDGKLTGLLVDNAVDLVINKIPQLTKAEQAESLQKAEKDCFSVGLTTVDDAGLDLPVVSLIDELQKSGKLQMRIYAMLNPSPENKKAWFSKGPQRGEKLNVSAVKVYADGALGSRGACLLHPYTDRPTHYGTLLSTPQELADLTVEIYDAGFQMATHCIGDSANRMLLNLYNKILPANNNRRWRIEHAQVVNPKDQPFFRAKGIIPSVQPTHCTSDMYWAGERLGRNRLEHAYAYKDLFDQSQVIAFGSDFPVESINPIYGFHAAISRQDAKNFPKGGFQPENSLPRETALRAMTIYAAYSNFEEKSKGSIEKGKLADFVILDGDLMKLPNEKLRNVKVQQTWLDGKKVFGLNK